MQQPDQWKFAREFDVPASAKPAGRRRERIKNRRGFLRHGDFVNREKLPQYQETDKNQLRRKVMRALVIS